MNRLKTSWIASLLIFSANFAAFAWDTPGHMAVGGLAYDELSTEQQTKLVALLNQHPGFELIQRGYPNGAPDGRELVMAMATWPDLARDDSHYADNGYETNDPAITAVTADKKKHEGWHFIDKPYWVGA